MKMSVSFLISYIAVSAFFFSIDNIANMCYSIDSYVHAGKCVGNRSRRHDADSQKKERHKRMSPTCRDDISDMSATDKNVCRLRGVADRHICRHCQPRSTHS